MNHKFEQIDQEILKNINIKKDSNSFLIALRGKKLDLYEFNCDENICPDIVNDIKSAFLSFIKTIKQNPNFDIENLMYNLSKNIIIGIDMNAKHPNCGTIIFDESKNIFKIYGDKSLIFSGAIYHELFHLASFSKTKKAFRRGFKEGYTEALAHRYFNLNYLSYQDNVYYALELEKIIGQDTMEEAYSKGDISIINQMFNDDLVFNIFNDKMDLLLGSYYRQKNNQKLENEDQIIKKTKQKLEECLKIIKQNTTNKEKTK